jgi:hypothetical protein
MKDTHTAPIQTETVQSENTLESLEDPNVDLNQLNEKKRLSTAMSSYYLLYR